MRFLRSRHERGATMVEFAMVLIPFMFIVLALVNAATLVSELQAANYGVQAAGRWVTLTNNFGPNPALSSGYGMQCNTADSSKPVPPGMVATAKAAAGIFASDITASSITTQLTPNQNGCIVTLRIPVVGLDNVIHIGPQWIIVQATDHEY